MSLVQWRLNANLILATPSRVCRPRQLPNHPHSASDTQSKASESAPGQISQNIETILGSTPGKEEKISRSQRILENASGFLGRPLYLAFVLLFVALWMITNLVPRQ
jgi:uncharacterized membrane protein